MLNYIHLYLNQQCCLSAVHSSLLKSNLDVVKTTLETIKATINSHKMSNLKTENFSNVRAHTLISILDTLINDGALPTEIIRGCKVSRFQLPDSSHFYHQYSSSEGYEPIKGGDSYGFAVKHDGKRQVISYTEGDVTELTAYSESEYEHEVNVSTHFYAEEF